MPEYINKDDTEEKFRKLAHYYFDKYYADKTDLRSRYKALGYSSAADEIRMIAATYTEIPDTDSNTDLISRSELQSEIAKCVGECRIKAFDPSVNCILQIIHRMPTADVQPVKLIGGNADA